MYTKKYHFPESAIQIINNDSYHLIENVPEDFDFHKIVELMLPFEAIKTFVGDRYGEIGKLPEYKIDYVCQWNWEWFIDKDWIL